MGCCRKDEYTYSFYHITGNHTVSVTFTAKTYELEFGLILMAK